MPPKVSNADTTPNGGAKQPAGTVAAQRRRLSVASDNKFIEGVEKMNLGGSRRGSSIAIRQAEEGSHISGLYGVSKKGYAPYNPRKKNQDALKMVEDAETDTQAILVLDGHGEAGDSISGYFKDRFCDETFNHPAWRDGIEGMKTAIRETIVKLEAELIAKSSVDTEFSGTTFVFTCMRGNKIVVANVGDSRCTLARAGPDGALVAEPISIDHKPDAPLEQQRIEAAGGRVFAVEYDDGVDGPPRVWLGHMDIPGLAMSRSIGDVVAHSAGVSSEPEFFVRDIDAADHFIVSATDGLWEFLTDADVVKMASSIIDKTGDPKACVDSLVEESNARWMKNEQVIDDTTIAIAFFQAHPPQKKGT